MLRKARRGEVERDGSGLEAAMWYGRGGSTRSSADKLGDDNAEGGETSSASETCPLSRDAAKLLEISGSDINAYDECECVEVVETLEEVLSRPVRRDVLGSSCHIELVVSRVPYRCPCNDTRKRSWRDMWKFSP